MGNRAVITLEQNPTLDSLGIYLHWNGGPESVLAFAQAAYDLDALDHMGGQNDYALARLVQIIGNFFRGTLSLGVDKIRRLDHDNRDNGLFVISVVNDKALLLQYPRGLTKPTGTDDPYYFAPRAVNHDSVSTHPYWNDPETGEKEALLNGIKSRNAGPFGEWKDETLTDAAPELLAAAQAALSALEDPDFDEYMGVANLTTQLRDAITKATTAAK